MPARRCRGHRRDGQPCGRTPPPGSAVCFSHGAGAPQVAKTAAYRALQGRAADALKRLHRLYPQAAQAHPIDFSAWPEDWSAPYTATAWITTDTPETRGITVNESYRHQLDPAVAGLLRAARKRLGLGLKPMAARAGISFPYLCLLELGQRAPSAVVAESLVDALGLDGEDAERVRAAGIPGVGRDWSGGDGVKRRDRRP